MFFIQIFLHTLIKIVSVIIINEAKSHFFIILFSYLREPLEGSTHGWRNEWYSIMSHDVGGIK